MRLFRRLAKRGIKLFLCRLFVGSVMSSSWYFCLRVIYEAVQTLVKFFEELASKGSINLKDKLLSYDGLSIVYVIVCVLAVLLVTRFITKYGFLIIKGLGKVLYR